MDLGPHSFSLLDPDPDPGGKIFQIKTKKARKLVITASSFNLHNLHCFLPLSNLLCFLQLTKTLHKVIFNKVV